MRPSRNSGGGGGGGELLATIHEPPSKCAEPHIAIFMAETGFRPPLGRASAIPPVPAVGVEALLALGF